MRGLFRDASLLALGGAAYGLGQWLLLAWLTRSGGLTSAGDYAFILAVANPVFLFLGLSLREVLATDTTFQRDLAPLIGVRLISSVLAGVTLVAVFALTDVPWSLALAVIVLKMIEAVSDLCYGAMQRRGAAGASGISFFLRVGGGVLAALVLALIGSPIALVLAGIGLAWTLVLVLHDLPKARATPNEPLTPQWPGTALLTPLIAFALPLTFTAALTAFAYNTPRYALKVMGTAVDLGAFSTLSSFAVLGQVLTAGAAAAAIGRLSTAANSQDRRTFSRVLGAVTGACLLLGLGLWVGSIIAGEPVTRLAFGAELAARVGDLPVIILLYLPVFVAQPLSFATIALGRRRAALAGSAAWAILGLLIGMALVPVFGLIGAGIGLCVGALAQNAITLTAIVLRLRRFAPNGDL